MARWSERLHPRDMRGRFTRSSAARAARRAGRAPANPEQARARRRANRAINQQLAAGVLGGGLAVGVGRYKNTPAATAAGLGRVGLAAAEARNSRRAVRRATSRDFAALNADQQQVERARLAKGMTRYRLANLAGDAATAGTVQYAIEAGRSNRQRDADWRVRKVNEPSAGDRFGRFQGPAPHRAKRSRRGIYDVTSSPVRKPRGAGARGFYKRRTGRSARARARNAPVRNRGLLLTR